MGKEHLMVTGTVPPPQKSLTGLVIAMSFTFFLVRISPIVIPNTTTYLVRFAFVLQEHLAFM